MNWTAIALIAAMVVAVGCGLEPAGTPGAETNPTTAPQSATSADAVSTTAQAAPSPDRDALIAIYNAADGANWRRSDNWLSDEPIGDWFGVDVDAEGRATVLDLDGNRLSGELPPEIGELANLEKLYLANNWLSGEFPPEIGELANLQELELSRNGELTGCVPGSLRQAMRSYGYFVLPFCPASPEAAAALAAERDTLIAFYNAANGANWTYSDNWLSDRPVWEWQGVDVDSDGRVVGLRLDGLIGEIPPEIGDLANLENLELRSNRLSGEIPPEIGKLSNLVALYLYDKQLSGEIPP